MNMHYFGGILIPTGQNIPAASAEYIVAGLLDGVFVLAGIIAVIMLLLASFRYVTSSGDSANLSKAKDGIIYSIVGLIVIIAAFAVVRLVMQSITGGPTI